MDPSTNDLPAEQCFEPAEALAVERALLTQPGALPEDPEAVAEDLPEDQAVLSRLERARVRWHLGSDFCVSSRERRRLTTRYSEPLHGVTPPACPSPLSAFALLKINRRFV